MKIKMNKQQKELIEETVDELATEGIKLTGEQLRTVVAIYTRRRMSMLGRMSRRTMTSEQARLTQQGKRARSQ